MLTKDKFEKGLIVHEQIKYNINYDRKSLFNIICARLANRLLSAETFAVDLTGDQKKMLQSLINR
jgi:predicted YcjX-like family ATPase